MIKASELHKDSYVDPRTERYQNKFIFLELSEKLYNTLWVPRHEKDGNPWPEGAARNLVKIFDKLEKKDWLVSLYQKNVPKDDTLVVCTLTTMYRHLKSGKMMKVAATALNVSGDDNKQGGASKEPEDAVFAKSLAGQYAWW